jgi:hypothetical protein
MTISIPRSGLARGNDQLVRRMPSRETRGRSRGCRERSVSPRRTPRCSAQQILSPTFAAQAPESRTVNT